MLWVWMKKRRALLLLRIVKILVSRQKDQLQSDFVQVDCAHHTAAMPWKCSFWDEALLQCDRMTLSTIELFA